MKKRILNNVTLLGIDCLNVERLQKAMDISQQHIEFAAAKLLTSLSTDDPRAVRIDHIGSIRAYSEFCLRHLADYVETEYVLIIQHDGFILNPSAWTDDFLSHDYIGAPFAINGQLVTGNGGFSLRSKKLLEVTKNDPTLYIPAPSEDTRLEDEDWLQCVTFREHLEKQGILFAPAELARRFSIEGNEIVGRKWTDEFGFHGVRHTNIAHWLAKHPEHTIPNPLGQADPHRAQVKAI